MAVSAQMESALRQPTILAFVAVEILAPAFTIRLLDGSSELVMDGQIYVGGHPVYGTISGIEGLGDGMGDEAPSCRIVLHPPTNVASADLGSPDTQGATVNVWFGILNPENGAFIDRNLWFAGEIDQATLQVGGDTRTLTLECTSMDLFFEQDTGTRLTNSWHQYVWPGERGLEFHTSLNRQVPWGVEGRGGALTIAPIAQGAIDKFFGRS